MTPPELESLSEQMEYDFTFWLGDVDNDGYLDMKVERSTGGDPDDGVIHQTVLMWDTSANSFVPHSDPAVYWNNNNWTLCVDQEYVLGDYNVDGYVDILVKDLGTAEPMVNQIIFSSGAPFEGAAQAVTAVDVEFQKFFSNIYEWMQDPTYFEQHYYTSSSSYTTISFSSFGCGDPYYEGIHSCTTVTTTHVVWGYYDWNVINYDALDFADAWDLLDPSTIIDGGKVLPAEAQKVLDVLDVLEGVLGDEVYGGVLRDGGLIIPELGLPDYDQEYLDDKRGWVLRTTILDIEQEANPRPARFLTSGEVAMGTGEGMPMPWSDEVLVFNETGPDLVPGAPFPSVSLWDGHMYFPGTTYRSDYSSSSVSFFYKSGFLHELFHVYQFRGLGWNIHRIVHEASKALTNVLEAYCYMPWDNNKDWNDYTIEQQAQMFSDRYLLRQGEPVATLLGSCQNSGVTEQQLNGVIPF